MPPKVMTRLARPARHRAGKPIGAESDSSSEEESGDEQATVPITRAKQNATATASTTKSKATSAGRVVTHGTLARAMTQDDEQHKARAALERKAAEEGFVTESEDDEEDQQRASTSKAGQESSGASEEESGEDSDDDEDESDSSEDGLQPRKFVLPKFMTKAQREKAATVPGAPAIKTSTTMEDDYDEERAERERLAAADALVEEQLRKRAEARLASKSRKMWEDSNEGAAAAASAAAQAALAAQAAAKAGSHSDSDADLDSDDDENGAAKAAAAAAIAAAALEDVDTEDDVDPEAEYAAWKLRELKRIKRQRERIEEKEKEREELERRRNLTEEERNAEDAGLLAKQREDKESRGKVAYMQKYFHHGAFYQDASAAEGLDKRDLMGARYQDAIRNPDLLPKALQIRDVTKLGKKGASKYRDMKSEDTGRWGAGLVDDYRPNHNNRYDSWGRERPGWVDRDAGGGGYHNREDNEIRGANAIPLGERKSHADRGGHRDQDGSDRDRSDRRARDDRDRRWSRSRSRSPRKSRDRHDRDRLKQSPPSRDDRDSRDRDYDRDRHSDKRRRVET
ncbi:hypothetical protein SEPCBS57363_002125 [Sporothrix epigloea]|uniref:Micro-fibrillar-associated protein 1 C-terminal domain-containing protein n=1 Tax=Sporothrix epigloea TaxID=1892477 RepID=A0ABP0DE63_9PEZI